MRWLAGIVVALGLMNTGCPSTLGNGGPGGGLGTGAEADHESVLKGPRARDLLAARAGRVLWFEVRNQEDGGLPREVALFARRGKEGQVDFESLGLGGRNEASMRLLVRRGELWVMAEGLAQGGQQRVYREQDGGGRPEPVLTPAGRFEALRFDQSAGEVRLSYWFAPRVGLVRFELRVASNVLIELVRCGTARWGIFHPGGYPSSTPSAAWESLRTARRNLDVGALRRLLGPALWSQMSPNDLDPLGDNDPLGNAELVREVIPQLLEVRFAATEPWTIKGDEAHAKGKIVAELDGALQQDEIQLTLERAGAGWRWVGFERPGATPPEDGANPPKDGANPPKDGANPPEDGATPPKDGATSPKKDG